MRIPSDFRRGRAFQIPRPFGGMTVLENVIVGTVCSARLPRKNPYKQCVEILELCGLVDLANRRAESLGLSHRKRLELARSLATQPRVLLLDEIGSGLTDAEAAELVNKLVARHGLLQAVREVSLSVAQGEVLALVGANSVSRMVSDGRSMGSVSQSSIFLQPAKPISKHVAVQFYTACRQSVRQLKDERAQKTNCRLS